MIHVQGNAFVFGFGCVVIWGLDEDEDKSLLRLFTSFEKETNNSVEMDIFRCARGSETKVQDGQLNVLQFPLHCASFFFFCFNIAKILRNSSKFSDGVVVLERGERAAMSRLVISHAMAQSTKVIDLSAFFFHSIFHFR
jgi:uncharacterized Rmd1/YagE family protein